MRTRASFVTILFCALLAGTLGSTRTGVGEVIAGALLATPAPLVGVESVVLGSGAAEAAPGYDLAVGRVTIAPGATIPPHVHPGTQVATIVSGALTYTVLSGQIPVTVATDGGETATPRAVGAGETVVLRAGDSVAEQPGAAHTARNAGDEPVVILLATLFAQGEPRTILVAATPTP